MVVIKILAPGLLYLGGDVCWLDDLRGPLCPFSWLPLADNLWIHMWSRGTAATSHLCSSALSNLHLPGYAFLNSHAPQVNSKLFLPVEKYDADDIFV